MSKLKHDYTLLSDTQLRAFQEALYFYESTKENVLTIRDGKAETSAALIREVVTTHLQAYDLLERVVLTLKGDSLVLAALVHTAGEPQELDDEDEPLGRWAQSCVNCGSWLAVWSPGATTTSSDGATYEVDLDDYAWWPPGQPVAKSDHGLWVVGFECDECGGSGRRHAHECAVCGGRGYESRELRPGERLCVGKDHVGWLDE